MVNWALPKKYTNNHSEGFPIKCVSTGSLEETRPGVFLSEHWTGSCQFLTTDSINLHLESGQRWWWPTNLSWTTIVVITSRLLSDINWDGTSLSLSNHWSHKTFIWILDRLSFYILYQLVYVPEAGIGIEENRWRCLMLEEEWLMYFT